MRLPDHVRRLLAIDPRAEAVEVDSQWFRWADISAVERELRIMAASNGIPLPARIAVVLRNRFPEYAALTAVVASGSTLVTLNPMRGLAHLTEELGALRPPIVLADENDWADADLVQAASDAGSLGVALTRDVEQPLAVVTERQGRTDQVDAHDPSVAVLMQTSGTTGPPKRIPLRYADLEQSLSHVRQHHTNAADDIPVLRSGVVILMNPPVHMAGFYGALRVLAEGRRACLLDRFTVDGWAAAMERHHPKIVSLVPTAIRMVYDAGVPTDVFDRTQMVLAGSAPLPVDLWEAFEARYGVPILVNYGATEFSGGITGWTIANHHQWIDRKRGSVGLPHPGVRLRIVDESGTPLPVGEPGNLEVKAAQMDAGRSWVRTNDRAHLDEDGFLWLHGRADGVIMRGGFKIWPNEVEDVLQRHPAVREAAVVGRGDERLGQVPVAVIELVEGAAPPSPDEIIAFARARLTGYQTPTDVVIVDDLPRNASLKISRADVQSLVMPR